MKMVPPVPDLWQPISDMLSSDTHSIWVYTPGLSGVASGVEGLVSVFVLSFNSTACVASHSILRYGE